jgi:hypothetical protein
MNRRVIKVEVLIMAARQQIILVNLSNLVRDMLEKVISKTPGLEIAANEESLTELPGLLDQIDADWVIVLLPPDGRVPNLVKQAVREHISTKFLLMGVDGSHVRLMYSKPYEVPLAGKNLPELLELLQEDQFERIQA